MPVQRAGVTALLPVFEYGQLPTRRVAADPDPRQGTQEPDGPLGLGRQDHRIGRDMRIA
jgi:hypothetical protein